MFVYMGGFIVVTFSGLRRHGGSPPRAPGREVACAWAYRVVLVLNCSAGAFSNLAHVALGAIGTPHLVSDTLTGTSTFRDASLRACAGFTHSSTLTIALTDTSYETLAAAGEKPQVGRTRWYNARRRREDGGAMHR